MYYEINVALNGRHYFATAERSLLHKEAALRAFWDLFDRFPANEGFLVTLNECHRGGREITPKRRKK